MNPARIPVVDDHAVVRGGFRQFLAATPDLDVAGEAGTGAKALALVRTQDWDLVLLDTALPDLNGMAVLKRIRDERPDLPVLFFNLSKGLSTHGSQTCST